MIRVMAWEILVPCAGGRCGRGSPPPATGAGGLPLGKLDILHKKSCIFVYICMILDIWIYVT